MGEWRRRWQKMRWALLLLKPLDVYPPRATTPTKVLRYLDDRCRVHKETINHCMSIIEKRFPEWQLVRRNNLSQSICHFDFDLVITAGGDGTLLKASHFIDDSVPVLGVNSDPTNSLEVEELSQEFDATRSRGWLSSSTQFSILWTGCWFQCKFWTGYLCAATRANFEQVLDEVLEGKKTPTELSRVSLKINGAKVPTFALNDILMAHPCPASVSRFSFKFFFFIFFLSFYW